MLLGFSVLLGRADPLQETKTLWSSEGVLGPSIPLRTPDRVGGDLGNRSKSKWRVQSVGRSRRQFCIDQSSIDAACPDHVSFTLARSRRPPDFPSTPPAMPCWQKNWNKLRSQARTKCTYLPTWIHRALRAAGGLSECCLGRVHCSRSRPSATSGTGLAGLQATPDPS